MTTRVLSTTAGTSTRATALYAGLALAFAAATVVTAQLRIPLPFTPVPITGQTAVVLLAGAVLGAGWGAAAMGIYLLAGLLGAPVFAGGEAGAANLIGPTGGYLLAFLAVPPVVAAGLPPDARPLRTFLVLLAASGIILLWGMLQLALALDISLERAFLLGVAPFLAGDLIKVAAATAAFAAARGPIRRLRGVPPPATPIASNPRPSPPSLPPA